MRRFPLIAALLLAPALAHAERKKSSLPPADPVHDFHTTDRFTPVTTFGVELGFVGVDDGAIDTAIGFDVGGHFVSEMGAGGYVVLPISFIQTNDVVIPFLGTIEGGSELSLGNIELGGLYAHELSKHADLVAHLGVALPTADDDNPITDADEFPGALQAVASVPRYGDLVQRWPNTTWLRLGVSPMGRVGPVFFRADLGLDLEVDDDDDAGVDISPVIRLNLAGGVDLGKADITLELVNNITDPEDDNADDTASTFAIGSRFDAGNVQPGVALILPIGFDDNVEDTVDFAIAASLMVRVP